MNLQKLKNPFTIKDSIIMSLYTILLLGLLILLLPFLPTEIFSIIGYQLSFILIWVYFFTSGQKGLCEIIFFNNYYFKY